MKPKITDQKRMGGGRGGESEIDSIIDTLQSTEDINTASKKKKY